MASGTTRRRSRLARSRTAATTPRSSSGRKSRRPGSAIGCTAKRSEEHTSELQSPCNLVCRLLLEKKKQYTFHLHAKHSPILQLRLMIPSLSYHNNTEITPIDRAVPIVFLCRAYDPTVLFPRSLDR